MSRERFDFATGFLFCFCVSVFFSGFAFAQNEELLVFDAAAGVSEKIQAQDVSLKPQDGALHVETGQKSPWPTLLIVGPWAMKDYGTLVLELENHDENELTIHCRIDMPGADGASGKGTMTRSLVVPGKTTKLWEMPVPAPISKEFEGKFFAMRGNPFTMQSGSETLFDRTQITEIRVFVSEQKSARHFSLRKITAKPDQNAQAPYMSIPAEKFFPMIDRFGQFMHKDWPGKVKDETDLKNRIKEEFEDWKTHPGPENWSQYGGWKGAPLREATGHFRVEKIDERWWLIDPEGHLFWSHGSDCVNSGEGTTPITDREFYFQELPDADSPYGVFYGTGTWAPHNYYEGRGQYKTFNLRGANLYRKYGNDWEKTFAELAHKRLRSWGMNTIANWSDARIYGMKRTPYTATVSTGVPSIQGSGGYWGKFPDPFHENFRRNYRRAFESQARRSAEDPWCIGYFVDNEISWGNERSLSLGTLSSPAEQPAKHAMLAWLKERYDNSIEKLNEKWDAKHADWDALLQSTDLPKEEKAKDDLEGFYAVIADQYFKVLSEELKRTAPNKMYLGCRFAWGNDLATRASAKYCEVISFNKYVYELDSFRLPEGIDKPCIIGEFHFGALDRGMFHTGLCPTDSQQARAAAYDRYVRSALKNPLLVGTHWFQYGDQATTGRGDGENYQIGLIDICDTPYPETIEAVRRIGYDLYNIRLGK